MKTKNFLLTFISATCLLPFENGLLSAQEQTTTIPGNQVDQTIDKAIGNADKVKEKAKRKLDKTKNKLSDFFKT